MSITFGVILFAAIVLAVIGISMNRARTRRGHLHHDGTHYAIHGDTGGSSHHGGDIGGRDASHGGGGHDGGWGDSGSGGDSGGDGGGGDGGGGE